MLVSFDGRDDAKAEPGERAVWVEDLRFVEGFFCKLVVIMLEIKEAKIAPDDGVLKSR